MMTDERQTDFERRRSGTWLRDSSGYLRDWAGFTLIVVSILALFVVVGVVGTTISWHARHLSCAQLQAQSGYDTRMVGSWFAGDCYVHVGDRWVPDSRYRMTDTNDAG